MPDDLACTFVEHPIMILRRENIESDLSAWHMPARLHLITTINQATSLFRGFLQVYDQKTISVNAHIILTLVSNAKRVCVSLCIQCCTHEKAQKKYCHHLFIVFSEIFKFHHRCKSQRCDTILHFLILFELITFEYMSILDFYNLIYGP